MTGTNRRLRGERHAVGRHVVAGLFAGVLTLGALGLVEQPLRDEALARLRLEVHTAAAVPRARLEQELSSTLALSQGMASLVAMDGIPDDARFAQMAAHAMRASPHIRSIGLAEGTVIKRVWPRQGNDPILGVDYRDLPEQWPLVERAITTGQPVLAGPVPLVQGGVALIQRKPVFSGTEGPFDTEPGRFLGLLGLVIDIESVLAAADLSRPGDGLRLAVRRRGEDGAPGQMIWGEPALFGADPELLDVALPGGEWQIAAVPARGWTVTSPLFTLLRGLELGAALLVGGGVFGLLRHRAERRGDVARLRASEARLRDAQRIGGMGAFEWDIDSGAVWWSDELFALFQWQPTPIVPIDRVQAAIHPDDREALMAAVAASRRAGGRLDHEYRMIRADGATRVLRSWAEVEATTPGGKGLRMRGLVLDVTDRARSDRERERLVARLRRSNEELERFATIAAHDLQEPLRQIASPLQLLQRRYAGRLDADTEVFIADAVGGAKRMQRQILDLLEFSRLGTAPVERQPVDTGAVVAEARFVLAEEEAAAEACVSVGPLPVVPGDRGHLVLLFTHLLRNALRFRKPGAPAEVMVAAQADGDDWHFTIADNGIGVAAAYHDQIFDVFRRLSPPDGASSGIGLALCRRIVEHHDGRIWIESVEGHGAVVHVRLPRAPSNAISEAETGSATEPV